MSSGKPSTHTFQNHCIFSVVCEHLDQKSLSALATTCKSLKLVAYESLYANIFIHGETGTGKPGSRGLRYETPTTLKWSILYNHLQKEGNSLRLFERSLYLNPNLAKLIKRIASNDTAFILMNLDRWAKYFSREHKLRALRFFNVKVTHFLHTQKSLATFHRSSGILRSIRELQVKNIGQLIEFATAAKFNGYCLRLDSLSLYSCEFYSGCFSEVDNDLLELFSYLKDLEIESIKGDSLALLNLLQQHFSRQKLFPRVERLSLNHVHSSSGGTSSIPDDRLEFGNIVECFDAKLIKFWSLKVGCLVCSETGTVVGEEVIRGNLASCNCLENFFDQLLAQKSNIEILYVQRRGPTLAECPLNIYFFKKALFRFFKQLSGYCNTLHTLILDTQCELAIPGGYPSVIATLTKPIISLNDAIIDKIKKLHLRKLVIYDYYEAFTIWKNSSFLNSSSTALHNLAEHCNDCRVALDKFKKMVSVNSRIQFYLDPMFDKAFEDFDYDLTKKLLSYLRNPSLATLYEYDMIRHSAIRDTPVINSYGSPTPQVSKFSNWFLHDTFHHEGFKDLVYHKTSYSQDSDVSGKNYTVDCNCRGDELAYFSQLLAHGIDVKFQFKDVFLNGLAA